jgi:hypothetical protein
MSEPSDRFYDAVGDEIPMRAVLVLTQDRLRNLERAVRNLLDNVNARYPDKNPREWTCPHMAELDRLVSSEQGGQ